MTINCGHLVGLRRDLLHCDQPEKVQKYMNICSKIGMKVKK